MKLVLALACLPLAAWGGPGSGEPRAALQVASTRIGGRQALFAADALQTAQIVKLGVIEGIAGSLRADTLYLADGIGIVQGKQHILAALQAADPDEDRAAKTPKEHLSPGDHEALDRLVSGQGR